MTRSAVFIGLSCMVALIGACGGGASEQGSTDGGPLGDGSIDSPVDAPTIEDAGAPKTDSSFFEFSCVTSLLCPNHEVCCASLSFSGLDIVCQAKCTGLIAAQVCESSIECPTGQDCVKSALGISTCKPATATQTKDAGGGSAEAGGSDSGSADSGTEDSGTEDAGSHDGGAHDGGVPESGTAETGAPEASTPDAGPNDSGVAETGVKDSGSGDDAESDATAADAAAD